MFRTVLVSGTVGMVWEVLFAISMTVAVCITAFVDVPVLRILLLAVFAVVLFAGTRWRFRPLRPMSEIVFGARRCLWVVRLFTDIWSLPFSYPKMYAFLPFFFSLIERTFRGKKRVKPKMTRVSVLGTEATMKILK